MGELARRSAQNYENTVRLLRYSHNICLLSSINAVFQSSRCSNYDTFCEKAFNLERNLVECIERVENVSPRTVCQVRETLFDKLDFFAIKYTSEQKLFESLATFDFEPTCVHEKTFKGTNATTWIRLHVPIPVCISSEVFRKSIFICKSDPQHIVARFVGALETLASQSKTNTKNLFLHIERTIENKIGSILEKLTLGHNQWERVRSFVMNHDVCENKICSSFLFL